MTTGADPLALWRRIDWRLLLPVPLPDVVRVAGRVDPALVPALRQLSPALTVLDDEAPGPPPGLVVLVDVAPGEIAQQVSQLQPGCWVYAEITTGCRRRPVAAIARAARLAGLSEVRAYWYAPNTARRTRIVPLGSRSALRDTVSRTDDIPLGRVVAVAARAVAPALLPYLVTEGAVLARVPGGPAAPSDDRLAAAAAPHVPAQYRPSTLLVTPSYPTSRHVVGLVFDERTPLPVAVGKIPRRPDDVSGIAREAEVLERLRREAPDLATQVPQVLGLVRLDGSTALLESTVRGRPLSPAVVRADRAAALRSGTAFTAALPVTGTCDEAWYDERVTRPLLALAARTSVLPPGLVDRTHEALAPLRLARVPAVFEHGDLSHPNLFVDRTGRLSVVDWERCVPQGAPAHDLVLLLTYLARACARAATLEQDVGAFHDAFVTDGWARRALAEHLRARAIPLELLPALVIACFARSAATLVERLAGAVPSCADLDAVVRADTDVALWQHALGQASQLRGAP